MTTARPTHVTVQRRKKPHWSEEQREAARQRALVAVKKGTLGGAPGRGGRPRKLAPVAQDLIRILKAEMTRRATPSEGQQEVMSGSLALAKIAHALDTDHEHLSDLLLTGTQQMVEDGQLAPMALLARDEVQLFNPTSRENKKRIKEELQKKLPASSRLAFPSDLRIHDTKKFSPAELIEALVLIAVMTYREPLSDAITEAILVETRRALPLVVAELEQRVKAA